jgi:hypothetical protein
MSRFKFWSNWKTTGAAVAVIVLWALKLICGVDISTDVAEAITVVIISIGLFFAADG